MSDAGQVRVRTKPGARRKFTKDRPPDQHAVEASWRMFIAIPLPQPVIERVSKLTTRLATKPWPIRWTAPDTAHLTLHFLGDLDAAQAELLRLMMPHIVAQHVGFTMQTDRLGVFPDHTKPRVLWMGLAGTTDPLIALYRDLARMLHGLEMPVEDRVYSPHITLGRARDEIGKARGMEIWTTLRGMELGPALDLPVSEVILYRSIISREGTHHEPYLRCPLG